MKFKYLAIFPILLILVECKYMAECASGTHTGERYILNVKVVNSDGGNISGANVISMNGKLEGVDLIEFGESLKDNENIEDILGVTNNEGLSKTEIFYLGCASSPLKKIIEYFSPYYSYPHHATVFIYKAGYDPYLAEVNEKWKFSKNVNIFNSNTIEIELNANKAF